MVPNWAYPSPQYNGISIGSAVLQGSRLRQIDRPRYSVCNRPHPHSTAMRPKRE